MNTRKYSRTMAEAFGPYTSSQLEPMPEADSASIAEKSFLKSAIFVGLVITLIFVFWRF